MAQWMKESSCRYLMFPSLGNLGTSYLLGSSERDSISTEIRQKLVVWLGTAGMELSPYVSVFCICGWNTQMFWLLLSRPCPASSCLCNPPNKGWGWTRGWERTQLGQLTQTALFTCAIFVFLIKPTTLSILILPLSCLWRGVSEGGWVEVWEPIEVNPLHTLARCFKIQKEQKQNGRVCVCLFIYFFNVILL